MVKHVYIKAQVQAALNAQELVTVKRTGHESFTLEGWKTHKPGLAPGHPWYREAPASMHGGNSKLRATNFGFSLGIRRISQIRNKVLTIEALSLQQIVRVHHLIGLRRVHIGPPLRPPRLLGP